MPITKNALIRYHTLDRCFQNPGRNYDVSALLEACNDALRELDPNTNGIKRRQLYEDIRFMESEQGYGIELDKIKDGRRVYYRYVNTNFSIRNEPINELEAEQLKSAMMVLSRFKGMPQFEWINELLPKLDQTFKLVDASEDIMSFESNPFIKGAEYLGELFNAILYKETLEVTYKSFRSEVASNFVFFPYHLKQFNSRWFVFGKRKEFETLTNLALDRIVTIKKCADAFIENKTIDFNEYFEDIIGVTLPDNAELIKITLKVDDALAPYITTKPIHGSQKQIQGENGYTLFTIEVLPNFELEKLIFSFGEQMEVLTPINFREKIKNRLSKTTKQYDQRT